MEWVETTGRTVHEAKEAALDQLGVDEVDAEFEVIEEPRAGLFGRVRGEARVRARVRPTAPRAKEDRRDRRRRNRSADSASPESASVGASSSGSGSEEAIGRDKPGGRRETPTGAESQPGSTAASASGSEAPTERSGRRRRGSGGAGENSRPSREANGRTPSTEATVDRSEGRRRERADRFDDHDDNRREDTKVEVALEEQGRIAEGFLSGLVTEIGLTASVRATKTDDDNLTVDLTGSDLGLLIGQKGATLLAIQDLTRNVVHHRTGASNGRIHVDVGGYRQKRSEALAQFAQRLAVQVKESGTRAALEPMPAADRKVVHDALTDVEGVSTISEGEDPRRRVVIVPQAH